MKVRREGRTEIPLRSYGRANETLKYLIRVAPAHGRLLEQRQTERETAVVVYEPPADLAITTDKFSYAVQSAAGVSAQVDVLLTIVDQPPHLFIPDALDFPAVRAGGTSPRMLEISNSGGGIATGEVIVDPPWRIDGKSGYRLRAGDVAIFKIIFAPSAGGAFDGVARFTSDPEHSTTLRGEAGSSMTVSPSRVVLEHAIGDPIRTGAFELANQTDEPRILQLKADARLQIPPQITVPGHGKITVPIQTAATDAQPLETEIHVEAPGFALTVPVRAARLGPILKTAPATIVFGRIKAGQPASAQFDLENIGGTPADATWEISAPFLVAQNSAILMAGEKRSFPIAIETRNAGRYRTWMQIKAGAQTLDLPVQAEVLDQPRKEGAPPSAPGASPASQVDPLIAEPSNLPPADRPPIVPPDWASDFSPPPGVKITDTSRMATLEWPASLSPATRFRLELRDMGTDADGNLHVTWLEPRGVPIERRGENFVATLKDLEPGQPWTVRVLPLNERGEPGPRLFALTFLTPPKESFVPKVSPLRALLAGLVALVAWQAWGYWRRRK